MSEYSGPDPDSVELGTFYKYHLILTTALPGRYY